jgi:hypothetical protein
MITEETGFPPCAPSWRSLRSRSVRGVLAGRAAQNALLPVGAGSHPARSDAGGQEGEDG